MWTIQFYRTENGDCPVENFLSSLTPKQEAKILWTLQNVKDFGLGIGMPHVKSLGGKLYEIRIRLSNDQFRIFTFHWAENTLVLLNGFTKKTQKTPPAELKKARKYYNDYLIRSNKEGNKNG